MPENPYRMWLKSIKVSGFEGVPPAPADPLCVEDFGHRNIFIGQNNTGKSLVLRLMQILVNELKTRASIAFQEPTNAFAPSTFWDHGILKHPIVCELSFSNFDERLQKEHNKDALGASLFHLNEWRLRTTLATNQAGTILTVTPLGYLRDTSTWAEVVRWNEKKASSFLVQSDMYINDEKKSPVYKTAKHVIEDQLKLWLGKCRFFDPIRSLDRASSGRRLPTEDGANLLKEMKELQDNDNTSHVYETWIRDVMEKINALFDPPFANISVSGTKPKFLVKKGGSTSQPVSQMGSGLEQMLIIYACLVKDQDEDVTYFLEEPESNLHPRLLRGFMSDLVEYKRIQFFITSHSNIILDSISERDRVFLFSQNGKGACSATPVKGLVDHHNILDALGVSGSALMLTNCIIWVEGPSDRLYVRAWLSLYADSRGVTLREGVDYSFVFYGGSILSHFEFEPTSDEKVQELISMLKISRFSAVIMDQNKRLTDAQRRIIHEAGENDPRRLAIVTAGHEIENDADCSAFLQGVASHLKVEPERFDGFSVTQEGRYFDEIAKHLTSDVTEEKKIREKLKDKVNLALAVVSFADKNALKLKLPYYVAKLFLFVISSRVTRHVPELDARLS